MIFNYRVFFWIFRGVFIFREGGEGWGRDWEWRGLGGNNDWDVKMNIEINGEKYRKFLFWIFLNLLDLNLLYIGLYYN